MIRKVGEEAVLLNLKTEQCVGLDDVSTRFWQVLASGVSIQSGYEILLAEFEVDEGRLRQDLGAFIEELVRMHLVSQNPVNQNPVSQNPD